MAVIFRVLGVVAIGLLLAADRPYTAPAEAPAAEAAKKDGGFDPLFNGKDLTGWVPVNVAPSTFTVRDGEIRSTGVPTGVMRTERMYENFVLEMEWMHVKPGGNAGLFIWGDALTAPGVPFSRGIEVQILDEAYFTPQQLKAGNATGHGDVFAIHGATMVPDRPHPKGWMRCLPSEHRSHPAGQWNHYRVECNDGRIELSVNGKPVSGGTKCSPRKGYLCLESEGGTVRYRNLKIKELPTTHPTPANTATAAKGFRSLYTGVDLSGWAPIGAGDERRWSAKDWILDYAGPGEAGGGLRTEAEYGDFELIVDWRTSPNGDKPATGATRPASPDQPATVRIGLRGGGDTSKQPIWTWPAGDSEWNRAALTMKADRLTAVVNGKTVIDSIHSPGAAARGPITLLTPNRAMQFANLYVRDLPQHAQTRPERE